VTTALPQARLAVAGHEGRQSGALYELRDRLGLAETVRFLGARTDVPELLCAADLFVFPSRWEGLSVAVLEAMALEAPIVASDIPPVREAVGGGAGAVLVPRERPELLARAVLGAVADPQGCAARAAASRRRFLDTYTSDLMADGMVQFYERALGR
jgi:glycosyltransferase involved in cell wall biosynthesis